jgi:hypothetical protein
MQYSALDRSHLTPFPDVLLCISSDVETQDLLLGNRLFGKQLLFHQIRQLQALGANNLYIAVETVSGALISLGDALRTHGLVVEFLRTPGELAERVRPAANVLLYSADMLVDGATVASLITNTGNTILVVEENEENQQFERIDLNSRWAGLALIEHKTLLAAASMPEGWDIASMLLRQCLQDRGVPLMIKQSNVLAGKIAKLQGAKDIEQRLFLTRKTNGWIEMVFFRPLQPLVTKFAWNTNWSSDGVSWAFPGFGLAAALLAGAGLPLVATVACVVAVIVAEARAFIKSTEFKSPQFDLIAMAGWFLLFSALGLLLHLDGNAPFDAIFLSMTVSGLALLSARLMRHSYLSPLAITFGLVLGEIMAATTVFIKVMVVFQLLLLAVCTWRTPLPQD